MAELSGLHPFLTGLYPGLAVELGSWRLEALRWSDYVDDVERRLRYVHVDLIPWDRVAHFGGRARHVADWIAELFRDSHAAAEVRLRECLVRDDCISQATPLALRSLLGALRTGLLEDAAAVAVEGMVQQIRAAALLVIEAERHKGTKPPRVDWSLYHQDRLWPRFESEARDAALLSAWRPSDEETLVWALLVEQLLEEHDRLSGDASLDPSGRR
jgi:hypothetical protein